MNTKTARIVGRSFSALAIGAALTLGTASLAGASGHRGHGGDCASPKVSPFSYQASSGAGGYVTAVTATSVTVQGWNGASTTYALTSTTTYEEGTTSTTSASLVVGDRVRIETSSTSPTTATSITIELAELMGKVTAVSGSTISVQDFQGFTRTIVVSAATTYSQGGTAATMASVVVGSKIIAAGTVDANGTSLDALKVTIGTAGTTSWISGKVTAASSTGLTVDNNGTSTTFAYTTSTTFEDGKLTLSSSNVALGGYVSVEVNTAANTTALSVEIQLTSVSGTVSAVSGDVITIADHGGFTRVVDTSATTIFRANGSTATIAAVVVGAKICAKGTVASDGTTLNALTVSVVSAPVAQPSTPGNGGGWGGHDGHGHHHRGHERGNFRH